MPDTTTDTTTVVLLDWKGRVVWYSNELPSQPPGDLAVDYVREDCRKLVRAAIQRVITHREEQQLLVVDKLEQHFRAWLWPLDSPDVAICALAFRVPPELALLSTREQDCLKLLADGLSAAAIAEELKIAVSTVHTHFKRSREKLNLPTLEALISFASRFCVTPACPGVGNAAAGDR